MIVVFLVCLIKADPAGALMITYDFEGSVDRTQTTLVPIGTSINGSLSIDLNAPLEWSGSSNVYDWIGNLQLTIGSESLPNGTAGPGVGVTTTMVAIEDIPLVFEGHAMDFGLVFVSATPFPYMSLANAGHLDEFSGSFYGDVFGVNGVYQVEFGGNINHIAPVPEPCTMLLLVGSGLVGLLKFRKRFAKA